MRSHGNAIYIKPVRYLLTRHRARVLLALDVGQSVKAARKYLGMYSNSRLQYLCNLLDTQAGVPYLSTK